MSNSPHDAAREPDPRAQQAAIFPQAFSSAFAGTDDPSTLKLIEFFERKGLAAIKSEEQSEQWYDDWLAYQARHRIYASVLSPRRFSNLGNEFDLPRYARFVEVFGYFSPSHAYSAQVTFLGLFSILMGSNDALKREAVSELERGELMAFGVSEKAHGSDLIGNEFTIREIGAEIGPGRFVANGSKYYIGNCNAAQIISTLARKEGPRSRERGNRAPIALLALRPKQSSTFRLVKKIRTLGVRAAFVGEFEVKNHEFPATDLIASGRDAWDAVFGTVTLGKTFLAFGLIGICEHAFHEAREHLTSRILYGKRVIDMPHIRLAMSQAYARLTAMKLFAYRTLDYVQTAHADDRRYLLFCAVQKARVSAEGIKVMALLSECIGAKGFEADTYFEMALRDVQLFPGLESSVHINLATATQFAGRYFGNFDRDLLEPTSSMIHPRSSNENAYLFEARGSAVNRIAFPPSLRAYLPLAHIPSVRQFARQIGAFRRMLKMIHKKGIDPADTTQTMAIGQCFTTIAYAQLVAEHVRLLAIDARFVSAIFDLLVFDMHVAFTSLASLPSVHVGSSKLLRGTSGRVLAIPRMNTSDWDHVAAQMGVA